MAAGTPEPISNEPVSRREAPPAPVARRTPSSASQPAAAAPRTAPLLIRLLRERSVVRGRTGRCTTCTTPTAIAATAVATWIPNGEKVPTDRTSPETWTRAATIEVTISTANAIAVPLPGRRRARPRRAIVLFHGARATMPSPTTP